MKLSVRSFAITSFLLTILTFCANAQNSVKHVQKISYLKTLNSIFNNGIKSSELKDSIALYAINFSIELVKKSNGKATITNITVNDNIAYKLFPSYLRLNSIDFSSLLGQRKKIRLVIPVLIVNNSETAKKIYKKDDGSSLIDMQSAINVAYSLYSTMPYNNMKDANIPVEHRIYKSGKDENLERINTNIIYLAPYIINILNIR